MAEAIKLSHNVTIAHIRNSRVIAAVSVHNLTTTIGKEIAAKLLGGITSRVFNYIQIGSGTTAAVIGDTTLVTFYKEKVGAATYVSPSILNINAIIDVTSTVSLTEAGLFDDVLANAPDLLARVVFTAVAAVSGDKFNVTWQVTVA